MGLIYDSDYRVVYQNLPVAIKGFVTQDDDFYTIVVNARHGVDVQRETILHELKHIKGFDFQKFCANDIENDMR